MPELVVGVDAGGTTTRCLAVSTDGIVAGTASAAGSSIRSSAASPQQRFTAVLTAALAGLRPTDVRAGVFGVAGGGAAGAVVVGDAAREAWREAGLTGTLRVVTDLEVAFAAGTSVPDGLLLLSGTGAAAASFVGRRIARRCDGLGWLLGDEGSAVWLGLRGIRAAVHALDGRGPDTRLSADVAAHYDAGPDDDLGQLLVARVHAEAPARLGEVAPLVTRAAAAGDAVAGTLVTAAADRLVAALRAVAEFSVVPVELVLAGSLLAAGPVRDAVEAQLAEWPTLRMRDAGPGQAGAATLALADLAGGALDPALHAAIRAAAS